MERERLALRDIKLSEEVYNIFEVEGITDIAKVLYMLEIYKFMTRSEILNLLRLKYPEEEFDDVEELNRELQFSKIESEYGVLVHLADGRNIIVYSEIYHDVATYEISLELARYNIKYCKLTRANFEQLGGFSGEKLLPSILFKRFLLEALKFGATDLHFTTEHKDGLVQYPVYYRRDGFLYRMNLFELDSELNKSIIMNLIEKKTSSASLDVALSCGVTASAADVFNNGEVELRISAFKVKDGYRCVSRIQQKKTVSFTIGELGFPANVQQALRVITKKRSGLTIIAGAIRTGKNTTAYALANEMLKDPINMLSFDSPIEVLMPFAQVDYREDPDELLNYVRLAKKQDVDIVYLNELPTKEVAFAAKDLVNSSVHVITTIHLDRIWHLPYRLKEYYGESYKDIITQINGVFTQKMFPVLCPHCRKSVLASDVATEDQNKILRKWNVQQVYKSFGCENCRDVENNSFGYVIGHNQPSVEFLLFSNELKEQLVLCQHPYEMEMILRKSVQEREQSLEKSIVDMIRAGMYDVSALDQIL